MKLSKTVNVILLPVLVTVFTMIGVATYTVFDTYFKNMKRDQAIYVATVISDKSEFQIHELSEFGEQIFDNYEDGEFNSEGGFIDFVNEELSEDENKNVVSVMVEINEEVVWEHSVIDILPTEQLLKTDGIIYSESNDARNFYTVTSCTDSKTTFCIVNGSLFVDDDGNHIHIHLVSRLGITEYVSDIFTQHLGVSDVMFSYMSDMHYDEISAVIHSDNSMGVYPVIYGDTWYVYVPSTYMNSVLEPIITRFVLMVILSVLLSFGVMKYLIHRNVITPIEALKDRVGRVDVDDISDCPTWARVGDNEVGLLHAAYVDIMQRINDMANVDFLTQLPNRSKFHKDVKRFSVLGEHETLFVLFIDLDNFKQVNDSYGHAVGDHLLQKFANELLDCAEDIGERDGIDITPYRLGGDEFAILISCNDEEYKQCCEDCNEAIALSELIISLFSGTYVVDELGCDVCPSIGIAQMISKTADPSQLLANADAAMYHVKTNGKNDYCVYNDELDSSIRENGMLTHAVNEAIYNDNFYLVYQPIFSVHGDKVLGIECLIRTNEVALIGYGPDKYIPVAEKSGAIKKIDDWVLENALFTLKRLIDDYGYCHTMSINISAVELMDIRFIERVSAILDMTGVPAAQVKLEVTETAFVSDETTPMVVMTGLKKLGVLLSLDDFGTGFTAFNQLMKYQVDEIKIDKCFVDEILESERNGKLAVEIIADLGKIYELPVTAEGVETKEQVEFLEKINCNKVQGYLYSKPVSFEELVVHINESER